MSSVDCSEEMAQLFNEYDRLRGRSAVECSGLFWDAVVFSVCDEAQRAAFEAQIARLQHDKAIPLVDYLTIADLPQYKMGSGGATMHILSTLSALWGQDVLLHRKILLVHTGGQSRRLPQHSAMGKLFARLPLPLNSQDGINAPSCNSDASLPIHTKSRPAGTMLDLKLAMYLPFCRKMSSGVFLTASDDIEIYAVDGDFEMDISGFTALAHPSSLEISRGHGVYVLPEQFYSHCTNTSCRRVLQKPSLEEMRRHGAIINNTFAYTDSAYAFGPDVVCTLISYYEANQPLNEELCAYGDFLTCLGTEAPRAVRTLQSLLQQFELSIIVLPKSKFYHIGTLTEYLDHFCSDALFKKQLGLRAGSSMNICSILPTAGLQSTGRHVIECCDFGNARRLVLGADCVLYGCQLEGAIALTAAAAGDDDGEVCVPNGVVIFTVAIACSDKPSVVAGYVTLCFGINDDLKTGTELLGRTKFDTCLWDAKLFRMAATRSESLIATLQDLQQPLVEACRYSMRDVLEQKCIHEMLDFQAAMSHRCSHRW